MLLLSSLFTCAYLPFSLEILIYYNYNSINIYNQIIIETLFYDCSTTQFEQRLSPNIRKKSNLFKNKKSNKPLSEGSQVSIMTGTQTYALKVVTCTHLLKQLAAHKNTKTFESH